MLFAWIASITYGLETVIGKLTSRHAVANPWLFNFVWSLTITIIIAIAALLNGAGLPASWTEILTTSIFYAAACIFYVLALYALDISVLGPLFNLRTAIAVILGALFLGEMLTLQQYFLIGVIIVFGVVVSTDEHFSIRSFFTRGMAITIAGMFCLALMGIFTKKAVAAVGYWNTSLWVSLIGQLWMLPTIVLFKKDVAATTLRQYGAIFITALVGSVGTLTATAAYAWNVSISSAIISLPISMFIAFGFALFAPELLEKHTLKVYAIRFSAAAIMIIAALNL